MEGCTHCTAGQLSTGRFGANLVTWCSACHALRIQPVTDPRLPSFDDHVRQLQEEIRLEEEEGEADRRLECRVESAAAGPAGSRIVAQVTGGNVRWVVVGSRGEARLGAKEEPANAEVQQRNASHLILDVDDAAWSSLKAGTSFDLRPATNATLYRNLLKAFLLVRRLDGDWKDLLRPDTLPRLGREPADVAGLTPAQGDAVRAALAVPDGGLALIQGPPGTGKTTVIARFLREAARRRKRVLVTSHTHVAIDNALRKALRDTPQLADGMVRLGESGRIGADLVHLGKRIGEFHFDPEEPDSRPLFAALQDKARVVGMTLDALACALLVVGQTDQPIDRFDYAVVDEAGMNAYPKLAIAHAVAKRMVLVGDPLQLPPIVRARSFRKDENHKRSHFEALQLLRPDLAVLLDTQFRCDPRIYAWSEHAIYGGRVHSGRGHGGKTWRVAGTPAQGPVVWLDTRAPHNKAEKRGSSWANPAHMDVALDVARELVGQGIHPSALGYITPFRAQAALWVERVAADRKLHPLGGTTASTVDAFQGSERKAIIFDLTTPVPAMPHQDHRRLNVSLTRAQELLVILGPRPYVRSPQENPYLWSLQNWADAKVVPAPLAVAQNA